MFILIDEIRGFGNSENQRGFVILESLCVSVCGWTSRSHSGLLMFVSTDETLCFMTLKNQRGLKIELTLAFWVPHA